MSVTKLCVSIAAETAAEMVRKAGLAFSLGSDLVEFRVDRLNDPSEAPEALSKHAGRAIMTVRPRKEGGSFAGPEKQRLKLLSELAQLGPAYLDVELSTATSERGWLRTLPDNCLRIVSVHDLETTPPIAELRRSRDASLRFGAIAKVITTARRPEDNLVTLSLCSERPGQVVSFCMGEVGMLSRVISLRLGSPVAYAALPDETVAPGQLSFQAMAKFRKLLL